MFWKRKTDGLVDPPAEEAHWIDNREKPDFHRLWEHLEHGRALCWLFAGDSITHGCCHTNGRRSYSEYFEQYIKTTPFGSVARENDVVINTGVSGATTEDMVHFFDAWITGPGADVAFLCFGMNDCTAPGMTLPRYRANLEQAVAALRGAGAIPILQTPNTSKRQKQIAPYLEEIRRLAREEQLLLIDHNRYWLAHKRKMRCRMDDALHPNAAGHLTWCRYLLRALDMQEPSDAFTAIGKKDLKGPISKGTPSVPANPTAQQAVKAYVYNQTPATWVFAGGTVTQGLTTPPSARNYVQQFNEICRWNLTNGERMLCSKTIVNSGRHGYDAAGILAHYEELVGRFHPDVVCLLPEEKEAESPAVSNRIAALLTRAKADAAVVIMLQITPNNAVRQAALAAGAFVLDCPLNHEQRCTPHGQDCLAQALEAALLRCDNSKS